MKLNLYLVLFSLAFFSLARAGDIFLKQPDWKEVLATAKAQHKYILVDAYTNWCGWCKVMDKSTFPDSSVSAFLSKNFVCVKMEMETGFGCELAMKYRVSAFPTFLVFAPDGRFMDRSMGYQKPEPFLKTINAIVQIPESKYPTGISASVQVKFPQFYRSAFLKDDSGHHNFADSAVVLDYLRKAGNLNSEVAWSVLWRYRGAAREYEGWILEHANELRTLYGNGEIEDVLNSIIFMRAVKAGERKDLTALNTDVLPMADKYLTQNVAEVKSGITLDFYKRAGNYAKALQLMHAQAPNDDQVESVNSLCWDVYEKCDDPEAIKAAVNEMKAIIDKEPIYYYLDTYASLLFKQKDYSHAEEYAVKAIATGQKNNQKVKSTEKLLEDIRAAQKG